MALAPQEGLPMVFFTLGSMFAGQGEKWKTPVIHYRLAIKLTNIDVMIIGNLNFIDVLYIDLRQDREYIFVFLLPERFGKYLSHLNGKSLER